jgi:SH3-like domain-containing protein
MFAFLLALALPVGGQLADELVARVKSDRVNLRARADSTAEVVAQATLDERLQVMEVQDTWVQVVPPERIDLWVHRDFVKDGLSVGDKVNVRAGAGINFSVVGQYARGERIEVRGQFGEWLKVAPSNSGLWVSRDLVDLVYPARPPESAPLPVLEPVPAAPLPAAPVPPASEPDAPTSTLSSVAVRIPSPLDDVPAVAAPRDLKLVPLEGQGRVVQREGELKSAPFSFGRPSKFRLARREGNQYVTICYLRGNSKQLDSLLNERLIVRGREYWVQGVRQSVLVLERIERPAR